ncbi:MULTISPECIES: TRM11 family SAM-dependent methyltransferase [Bacillus]|uniref:TRM11 family SAM-dependent methyltransferase n=1 Tax=Bacillus TaxID=1386 RepID=UPI001D0D6908|nr:MULTISPECIES: RNA methyltransferase [Bacillus]
MNTILNYVYNYTCEPNESSLCDLEKRTIFGMQSEERCFESTIEFNPSRSPFIRERIDVLIKATHFQELIEKAKALTETEQTYKVKYVHNVDHTEAEKASFKKRRDLERVVGMQVPGEPDLLNPDVTYGLIQHNDHWYLGYYHKSEAVWLHHQNKPNSYSVALNTRVARSVVNIAVPQPNPTSIKAIDPCCGVGTVLVEALSMNINMVGSDVNHLILPSARENIAHFGYHTSVIVKDIRDITEKYDVAIIDLPYNLCSVITPQEQLEMLQSTYSFAPKLVIITVEPIDEILQEAGFRIVDRGEVKKGSFTREIIVAVGKI